MNSRRIEWQQTWLDFLFDLLNRDFLCQKRWRSSKYGGNDQNGPAGEAVLWELTTPPSVQLKQITQVRSRRGTQFGVVGELPLKHIRISRLQK